MTRLKPVSAEDYLNCKDKDTLPIDEEGGIQILPVSGLVIKSKEKNGGKVFVNVTCHPIIDAPV